LGHWFIGLMITLLGMSELLFLVRWLVDARIRGDFNIIHIDVVVFILLKKSLKI
jgi:hypothetical protein